MVLFDQLFILNAKASLDMRKNQR